ncbi:uncharacterized protein MONOS_2965 [Monocercomonoides exilis]|uniref:uncharacterized protein n=1 Tax=Monocercomonoides exilis TaxID=2049356 RepID=UPI003559D174|nr:hypothetical protein MONOS_2965 [Monocercomonoides exilis]|eukprot:MONOS_2965.1-p1 / transcript=MONOS_2965.1 / gene=MONOS_2965 / organism=Monocercomonoides_exilis_PA203 / gene_product=unspecified product / transcript_product=unspecified product / location=Mono_scaffold00065:70849-73005(+) / protein_length=719 / sequence_SO=supercontig / SO=protein_coding / is_pseudo=false
MQKDLAHSLQFSSTKNKDQEIKKKSYGDAAERAYAKRQTTKLFSPKWQASSSRWLGSSWSGTSTSTSGMKSGWSSTCVGLGSEWRGKCESSIPFWVEMNTSETISREGTERNIHALIESEEGLDGKEEEGRIEYDEGRKLEELEEKNTETERTEWSRFKRKSFKSEDCRCRNQYTLENLLAKSTDEAIKGMSNEEEGEEWAREEEKKEIKKEMNEGEMMEGIRREKGWELEERKRGEMMKRWRWEDWKASSESGTRGRQEKRKERILRWRRQIEDAVKHWKVFGVWVRKEWAGAGGGTERKIGDTEEKENGEEIEEEVRMWEEAERRVLEKEVEREEKEESEGNEGMEREEWQVERYERAKRKGASVEDLDANTENPDLRYGGYGGMRRSRRSGRDNKKRKQEEEASAVMFSSNLLSQKILEEIGWRVEGDEEDILQKDLKHSMRLLDPLQFGEPDEVADEQEIEEDGKSEVEMRGKETIGEGSFVMNANRRNAWIQHIQSFVEELSGWMILGKELEAGRLIFNEQKEGISGNVKEEHEDWLMIGSEREDEKEEDGNEDDECCKNDGCDKIKNSGKKCLRVLTGDGEEKGGEGESQILGVRDTEEMLRRFYDAGSGMRQMRRERRKGKGGEGRKANTDDKRKEIGKEAQIVVVFASPLWTEEERSGGPNCWQRQKRWEKMEKLRKSISCLKEKMFEHNPLLPLQSKKVINPGENMLYY